MTTNGRVSQEVEEDLIVGDPKARVSQEIVEAGIVGDPKARVSQEVVEAGIVGDPKARVSQEIVEAGIVGDPHGRVSQYFVEMLIVNFEVGMPPIYPEMIGLGFDVTWTPRFWNMPTQTTAAGKDIDISYGSTPTHEFELTYDFLRDNFQAGTPEFRRFMGFFLRIGGVSGRFGFRNPDDDTGKNQFIATTDGLAHVWTLQRTFGVGEDIGIEPVGLVDTTREFNAYLDGVKVDPTRYTVVQTIPMVQQIDFKDTPTADQRLTVDMSYFYYCKFADDSMSFEKFLHEMWSVKTVTLRSLKDHT